jgi:hypothetical protein
VQLLADFRTNRLANTAGASVATLHFGEAHQLNSVHSQ